MEWEKAKGSTGFTITWTILLIFSAVMLIFDWKLWLMGIIVSTAFGFLGFDMLGDVFKFKKDKK